MTNEQVKNLLTTHNVNVSVEAFRQWEECVKVRAKRIYDEGKEMAEAVRLAVIEQQKFVEEMAVGQTERAKLARDAIAESVYYKIRGQNG